MSTRTSPQAPHVEFFPAPPSPGPVARCAAVVIDDVTQLRRFWPVVQNMVAQDLRVRYQRSMLGFFWTLVNPILMMTTLTFVFSQLMNQNYREYAKYLFAGLVPWGFLSASLSDCAFCIIQNEGLIRKIFLPKLVFPITRVLIGLVTLVLTMVALFVLLVPMGLQFSWPMLFLPAAIALFAVFTLGLGLLVATMNTFFRDTGHLVSVFLQAWYFATPILYRLDNLSGNKRWFLLNPAFPFIRMFQAILCDQQWPGATTILAVAALATLSLGVGYAAFKSFEAKFIFRL